MTANTRTKSSNGHKSSEELLAAVYARIDAQEAELAKLRKQVQTKGASKRTPAKKVTPAKPAGTHTALFPVGLEVKTNSIGRLYVQNSQGMYLIVGKADVKAGKLTVEKSYTYTPAKDKRAASRLAEHQAGTCTCNPKTGWLCPAVRKSA